VKARVKEIIASVWLTHILRLALGGIFVAASVGKLQYRALFTDTVIGYDILPHSLAEFYGTVLPWAELFIGCCLVLGVFSIFASAISLPLIVSFIVASVYGLVRPVGDTCSCFGELVSLSHSQAIALDVVMLLMAGQLLLHRDKAESFGLGSLLSRRDLGRKRGAMFVFRFIVVALVMVITVPFIGGTQRSLDDIVEGPQFLFFWDGCPDCFEYELNMIDELEQEYGDRIVFKRINYVEDPQAAEEFGVDSPTMLLIAGKTDQGEYVVHQRFEGTVDKEMLRNSFDQVLSSEAHNEG